MTKLLNFSTTLLLASIALALGLRHKGAVAIRVRLLLAPVAPIPGEEGRTLAMAENDGGRPSVAYPYRAPQRLLSVLSWCCNGACTAGGTTPAQNPSADRSRLRGLALTASPVRVPFVLHTCRAPQRLLNVVSWSIHYACRSVGPTGPAHNHCADRPGLRGSRQLAAPALTDGSTIGLNGGRLLG